MELKTVRLYDTYQGKKVDLVPLKQGEVSIYYCGPTVYNYAHIGNMRPVVTFDLLNRVLRALGYKVKMVSNYTDIDDKIIKKALEEHKSEKEVSDFYIAAYEDLLDKLNVLPLDYHPRVSNYIPEIADFIYTIMDKGYAYKASNGDIYFDVLKDPNYGSLSKMKIDDLQAGNRIAVNDNKHSPLDFALWKLTDDDGIKFDTKIGLGRPGWHTECCVMINSYFNSPLIDIHGGGFDLKFPHHENEMAQQYAYANTRLANIWMHVGFINVDNQKMSKSLGNVVLAKDAIDKYGGNVIRYLISTTYYRSPINFTLEAMETSKAEIDKYQNLLNKLISRVELQNQKFDSSFDQDSFDEFLNYLADDLNVPNAVTVLDRIVKKSNQLLRNLNASINDLSNCYNTYIKMIDVLGIKLNVVQVSEEDKQNYKAYMDARANKDFATSDIYRNKLMEKGLL